MTKKKKKTSKKHKVTVKKIKVVNKKETGDWEDKKNEAIIGDNPKENLKKGKNENEEKDRSENNKYKNENGYVEENTQEKNKNREKEDSNLVIWTAPEFIKTRGEMLLYYISIVASVFMIFWSFLEGNYVVTTTFILLIVVILFYIFRDPGDIECKIDFDGITVAGRFYGYEQMESFEIFHGDGFNTLKFKLRNDFLPVKEVQLAVQDPQYIRALLEHFLPEEKQKESLIAFEGKRDFDDNLSEEKLEELNKYERAESKKQKET